MLTGYNTEVESEGVVYHVQTEDRGAGNPLIESLVYVRGEILATRRTEYRELLDVGADRTAIQALMERQHRVIVESIRQGRIDLLTEPPVGAENDTTVTRKAPSSIPRVSQSAIEAAKHASRSLDEVISDWLAEQQRDERVRLQVGGGEDLHFGAAFDLRIRVAVSPGDQALPAGRVRVRFVTSAAKPVELASAETDQDGVVTLTGTIPDIEKGQALLIVSVQHPRGNDEVKFLITR